MHDLVVRMRSVWRSGRFHCAPRTNTRRTCWPPWPRRPARSTALTAPRRRRWRDPRPPAPAPAPCRRTRPTGATSTSFPRPTRARRCSAAPRAPLSSSSERGTWLYCTLYRYRCSGEPARSDVLDSLDVEPPAPSLLALRTHSDF